MGLVEFIHKLMNISSIKVATSEKYFSKVKGILEEDGYFVSELGLIMEGRYDYGDNLGDIRLSEKKVFISPSKPNHRTEVSRLADFLAEERIPFRYRHY